MKRTILALVLSVCLVGVASADPPPWEDYANTHQYWEFDSNPGDGSCILADVDENPFGCPVASVTNAGTGPIWDGDSSLVGNEGNDTINFLIPNDEDDSMIKEVWVQMLLYTNNPNFESEILAGISSPTATQGEDYPEVSILGYGDYDAGYYTIGLIDQWFIDPQPDEEIYTIYLKPTWSGGVVALDNIEIWTQCTPEPATMSLLGVGALVLLRRRRR